MFKNTYLLFFLLVNSTYVQTTETIKSIDALLAEAHQLLEKKQHNDAELLYRAVLELDPHNHQGLYKLGVTLFDLEKYVDAELYLQQALSVHAQHSQSYFYLGKIAQKRKLSSLAIEHFIKAISICDELDRNVVYCLTDELKENLRASEAIPYLRSAVTRYPYDVNLEFTLANTLNVANKTQEALEIYIKLNKKHPHDAGIVYNIAYTLKKLGRMQESLPYYEESLRLKPDHKEALFSQGLAYLVIGDWEKGWKGYEYRWDRSDTMRLRSYSQPQWNGEPLEGKRIFVYAEQGLGDTFQFVRYLKLLKNRGAYVIFSPQRALLTIFKIFPYIDLLVPYADQPRDFDYHVPLASLPYIFKTRVDSVPMNTEPYLYADPHLTEEWKTKLADNTTIKVGICWQGNSEYGTSFLRAAVAGKSMPATLFEPLTQIAGVTVYSLQHITGTDQLTTLPPTMRLITFDGDFDNKHGRFMDTAAIIKNLDLVITVDTSISHFAAALGTPVWNLLPNPPDWRWMLERSDTPWYTNMKLFRQPIPGDWQSVIGMVVKELTQMVAAKQSNLLARYYKELELIKKQKIATADVQMRDLLETIAHAIQAKIDLYIRLNCENADVQI